MLCNQSALLSKLFDSSLFIILLLLKLANFVFKINDKRWVTIGFGKSYFTKQLFAQPAHQS